MKMQILCLTSLFCCSTALTMNNGAPIPPAKAGAAAAISFVLKKCGLNEVCTKETKDLFSAFTNVAMSGEETIHELIQNPEFITLAKRAAERDYLLKLELIDAMSRNNSERIRKLIDCHKPMTDISEIGVKFLLEENSANNKCIAPDPHQNNE